MIKGMTRSGFEFEVEEKVMDNMELVDVIAEATDNDPIAISKITKMILGDEQKKRLYEHHRTDDGRVPASSVLEDVGEIFRAFGQKGKNS